MKNKQMCQVCKHNSIISKDKNHLFGKLVNNNQDSIKYGE